MYLMTEACRAKLKEQNSSVCKHCNEIIGACTCNLIIHFNCHLNSFNDGSKTCTTY